VWLACSDSLDPSTGLNIEVRRGDPDSVAVDSTAAAPVDSAGIVLLDLSGRPFGQVFTDTTGTAKLNVQPGVYRILITSCPGAEAVPEPENATVIRGTFSVVTFLCPAGDASEAG